MNEPNELSLEIAGVHGLNFAFTNNSSARSVMFASHFSQRLVIEKSTEKLIQTGLEYEFSKYTFNIKMPVDGTILKLIDRYPKGMGMDAINENPETLVIFENKETKEVGCFSIPNFQSYHQYFGFKYKFNKENLRLLIPGQFIKKDTIFADSPSVSENGGFNYGVSLNTAFMSHPAVSEDGILISEGALDKLAFSVFETRVVEFGTKNYPLNLYGNMENYKPFPDIGETIRDDGVLMMIRKLEDTLAPVDLSIFDTMEPDFIFDTAYYVRGPKGKIVDIKVIRDTNVNNPLPENMVKHINKYVRGQKNYYQEIIKTEEDLRRQNKQKFGVDTLVLAPNLHRLVTEGYVLTGKKSGNSKNTQKLSLIYRKTPICEYRVTFTIEYRIRPNEGFKITDSNGGKGVICKIEKDENMPIDVDGNRAELVMDSGSTIHRMNLGRLYEQYIGATSVFVRNTLKDMLSHSDEGHEYTKKMLKTLIDTNDKTFDQAYNHLLGFIKIISDHHYEKLVNLSISEKIEYMADVLCDNLLVYYPINNKKEPVDIVTELEKHYPSTYGPVSYVGESGNKVTTKRNIRIGPMYIMLLEKIADDWSAVSYGKLHHFGVLAIMTKSEKYTYPFRNNPVRTIGETEGRVFLGYCGKEAIAEMMDRSNNPLTQKQLVQNLLMSDKPSNIDKLINRNIIPYGGSRPLQLINHITVCSGWKSTFVKESK